MAAKKKTKGTEKAEKSKAGRKSKKAKSKAEKSGSKAKQTKSKTSKASAAKKTSKAGKTSRTEDRGPKTAKVARTEDRGPKTAKKSSAKADVLSIKGSKKGQVELPEAFSAEFRPDIIQRAFVFEQSLERQPYGSDPRAGFRTTADYYSRRRNYYRLTVNRGISRLPRQKRPGGGLGEVRRVPQSRGGHRAHPPKAEKKWAKKMNEKEWILALNSAIGATTDLELVRGNGRSHEIKDLSLPLIIEDSFESVKKASEVSQVFEKLGLSGDVERASGTKTKAGKARTGKKKRKTSVLVVVSGDCPAMKAAGNLAGVDVVDVGGLSVSLLAPGGKPGRLALWTEKAIKEISS